MSDEGFKSGLIYDALMQQAEDKALLVAPYMGSKGRAFLNGYETALSDIALGRLDVISGLVKTDG